MSQTQFHIVGNVVFMTTESRNVGLRADPVIGVEAADVRCLSCLHAWRAHWQLHIVPAPDGTLRIRCPKCKRAEVLSLADFTG